MDERTTCFLISPAAAEGAISPIPLDVEGARRAAELRALHYHRAHCRISLADAILLASARPGARIATADPDVLAVAKREGAVTIVLPAHE